MANAVTNFAFNRGNPLIDQNTALSREQAARGTALGDEATAYYRRLIEEGGYSPEEAAAIVGREGSGNIPGLDDLSGVSDADREAQMLTDDEQSGIRGNPNDPLGYLHSDTIGQTMTEGGLAQDAAVDQQRQDFDRAIDPTKLGLSSRYGTDVHGAVDSTEGKLDSITGSEALDLSDDFSEKYEMTPEQQRDIVNAASRDVGDVSRGNFDEAARRSSAAGVGPMGLNALQARMARGSSSDAAAAATKARIAASEAAAGRTLSGEQLRLNAGQTKAGLQSDAAKYTGSQRLAVYDDVESKRAAGERDISDRYIGTATTSGNNSLANKTNQTATKVGAVERVADREVAARQNADREAADRATQIATTNRNARANVVDQNYERGANANAANSARTQTVADTRINQGNVGGAGLTEHANLSSNNANTARGQAIDAFGNTGNIANTGQAQPGKASKIIGGVLGGVGAAAQLFRYGGVATKPTNAVLGEDGPEMVVPLGQEQAPQPAPYSGPPEMRAQYFKNMGLSPDGVTPIGQTPAPAPAPEPSAGGAGMDVRYGQPPQPQGSQNESRSYTGTAPEPTPIVAPNYNKTQSSGGGARTSAPINTQDLQGKLDAASQRWQANQPADRGQASTAQTSQPVPAAPQSGYRPAQGIGNPPARYTPARPVSPFTKRQQPAQQQQPGAPDPVRTGPSPAPQPQQGQATERQLQPQSSSFTPKPQPAANSSSSMFRYGGIATKPTSAILGEDGPEMVMPVEEKEPSLATQQEGWRGTLAKIGYVADGVNAGMQSASMPRYGGSPAQGSPQPNTRLVTKPTRALIGENGPEAVIPLNPRNGGMRMRPSMMPRYA